VQEVGGEIEDMREELRKATTTTTRTARGSSVAGGKGVAEEDGDLPDPSSFAIADGEGEGEEGEGDNYAEFEQQQQVQMMREQDQHLDGVFQTVGNLRRQANDMGRELEEQREALEVVDELADRVGGRLQTGVQKLGKIVRANEDRWSGCCIMVLIVVLIILLVLLLVL
jgi:t-SNARE syntaxin family protein